MTVGFFSLLCTVIGLGGGAAVDFGKQKSDLASSELRIKEIKEYNDQLSASLKEWRAAYEKQSAQLGLAQSRITELETDRCQPVKADIDNLLIKIEVAQGYRSSSADDISELRELMHDYQATLRACYAARGEGTK
jgi:chromosome segregation ATPase